MSGLGRGRAARAVGLVLAAVVGAGCGPVGDSSAGFGMPTQPRDRPVPGERTDVEGVLRVESNGCFTLELEDGARRWVVWPPGTGMDDDGVVLGRSSRVADGDRLTGTGALVDAAALPDWENADSYFRAFGSFCEAGETGVVVLDVVAAPA